MDVLMDAELEMLVMMGERSRGRASGLYRQCCCRCFLKRWLPGAGGGS